MAQKLAVQAQVYREMLSACLSAKNCTAFVMWGFTDRYSWISQFTGHPDAPLIFDQSYRPKPAYNALVDALNQKEVCVVGNALVILSAAKDLARRTHRS